MSITSELRESLEIRRREKLHRQIGAIQTRLERWSKCKCARHDQQFMKLREKQRRLESELRQPMLLPLG